MYNLYYIEKNLCASFVFTIIFVYDIISHFIKSLTIWPPENVFISGDNHHPTSRFWRVELDPTTFLNMVSESRLRSDGPPTIRFTRSPIIYFYAPDV